ncbi:MAG: DNA repair protein RadC [Pseudomonadota bacterium]|nr:DNA repair protein RadC [Pseudomonadota bacterium]
MYKGLQCRVCLVRECSPTVGKKTIITAAEDIYDLVKEDIAYSDREIFTSVMLSTKNEVVGVETVSIGTLNSTLITPREVFKSAILSNANAIIVCHNHPSGSLEPSAEDRKITRKLVSAGNLLAIEVIDHLIISSKGFCSFQDKGIML